MARPSSPSNVRGKKNSSPPTVPTNLAASSTLPNQAVLTWNAATDPAGVKGYRVYRWTTGDPIRLATVSGTTYTDTTAAGGTLYYYSVSAFDKAGNESNQSSSASVTPLLSDTTAPGPPTGLATSNVTSSSITLNWTAPSPTDQTVAGAYTSGLAGYRIYRGPTQVGTVGLTTSFTDTGLSASTLYSYTVRAIDNAGNVSADSNTAQDTTSPAGVSWPTQANTYLPAVRNRSGFAMATRHAFTVTDTPTIYRINTLDWTGGRTEVGDGTFYAGLGTALARGESRIIVFETSGSIDLGNATRYISSGNLWIAGQTAPAPGITLYNGGLTFLPGANNCLVQHVRIHRGGTSQQFDPGDALAVNGNTGNVTNIVFDHCDALFGLDECVDVGNNVSNVDFIHCVTGWHMSVSKGLLLFAYPGNSAGKGSWQGGYMGCSAEGRMPLCTWPGFLFANNLAFDSFSGLYCRGGSYATQTNIVGNQFKSLGGSTPVTLWETVEDHYPFGSVPGDPTTYDGATKIWVAGNYVSGSLVANQGGTSGWTTNNSFPSLVSNQVTFSALTLKAPAMIAAATPLNGDSSVAWVDWSDKSAMETWLLANVGAYPKTARSAVNTRLLTSYSNNTSDRTAVTSYIQNALAENANTFDKDAAGLAFDDSAEQVGGVYRKNIEVHLLNLGESA